MYSSQDCFTTCVYFALFWNFVKSTSEIFLVWITDTFILSTLFRFFKHTIKELRKESGGPIHFFSSFRSGSLLYHPYILFQYGLHLWKSNCSFIVPINCADLLLICWLHTFLDVLLPENLFLKGTNMIPLTQAKWSCYRARLWTDTFEFSLVAYIVN